MSVELFSNDKGEYSLEPLPDFYVFDLDDINSNVEVHTFSSQRDADFFLEGFELADRTGLKNATRPVALSDGRFGLVIVWRDGEHGLSQFNH